MGHATRLALREIYAACMLCPRSRQCQNLVQRPKRQGHFLVVYLVTTSVSLSLSLVTTACSRVGTVSVGCTKGCRPDYGFSVHTRHRFSAWHFIYCSPVSTLSGFLVSIHLLFFFFPFFFFDWIRVASDPLPGMSKLPPFFATHQLESRERRGLVE